VGKFCVEKGRSPVNPVFIGQQGIAFLIVYNKTVSKSVLFETVEFTNYIIAKDFYKVQFFSNFFIIQGLFDTLRL